jgi:hypothetical protein
VVAGSIHSIRVCVDDSTINLDRGKEKYIVRLDRRLGVVSLGLLSEWFLYSEFQLGHKPF